MKPTSLPGTPQSAGSSPDKRRCRNPKGALGPWLGGLALRGLAVLAPRLSCKGASRLGAVLGWVMLICSHHRNRIALRNLSFAFKEKDGEERKRILRKCCENVGKSLVEFLRLPPLGGNGEIHELVSLEGEQHLRTALGKGRGVILLTAHYGNWELVGAKLAACGYPLNVLARPQRDERTTRLMNRIREAAGMRVLTSRNASSGEILQCLRKGEIVGFLNDQNAGRKGVFVDFFGRPASTPGGAALFALRTKAAVVPMFALRNENDTHVALLLPEVEIIQTGNLRRDVAANTALFTRLIEEQIRTRPELWFWLHDRWRARPPEEAA